MKEPVWIDLQDCLAVQLAMLNRFGGMEGVRDEGLLDSALNRPRHLFAYGHPTLFDLAAEYAFGIVKNHPFLDGNKRTGFVMAAMFLELNGHFFQAPEEDVVLQTLALAAGEVGKKEYAAWLKKSCPKLRRKPTGRARG